MINQSIRNLLEIKSSEILDSVTILDHDTIIISSHDVSLARVSTLAKYQITSEPVKLHSMKMNISKESLVTSICLSKSSMLIVSTSTGELIYMDSDLN